MRRIRVIIPCLIASVYTLWYMHFDKPWTNDGALSTIGLEHRTAFAVWGILTFTALNAGILSICKKEKLKAFILLSAVSAAAMTLMLFFRFDYDLKPDYYIHCTASLVFSTVTGAEIFLLFLFSKNRLFYIITAVIMLSDLVLLLVFKETGLIEVLPIFAGYIMLSIESYGSEKVETARETENA